MQKAKDKLAEIAPETYNLLRSINFFRKCRRRLGPNQKVVENCVFPEGEIRILGGPFSGLRYYNKTIWGTITSKWLGCYEEELAGIVSDIISRGYPTVVDVGAAEGYYAVGLAKTMPRSRIISFDTDPIARYRQRQLAKLNGVGNLTIAKHCSHQVLNNLSGKDTVIICDIEGFEYELIDPEKVPNLRTTDILVECHYHDAITVSKVAETIRDRFSATHSIKDFTNLPRDREKARKRIPKLSSLSDVDLDFALDEGRYPGQVWLWMAANPLDQSALKQK